MRANRTATQRQVSGAGGADPAASPVPARTSRKVRDLASLARACERRRERGASIALAHGCFDVFHAGHVHHLAQARALADVLVVSVSPPEGCRKGPGRPVFSVRDRMDVLAALELVRYVCASPEATAVTVIEALRPDVYVKGPDHDPASATPGPGLAREREAVERLGGRVHFTDRQRVRRSTAAVEAHGLSGPPRADGDTD